jgi:hypothetical protein
VREEATLAEQIAALRREKERKARAWLSVEDFERVLAGEEVEGEDGGKPIKPYMTLHNRINRATGTTGGGDEDEAPGGLYPLSGESCERRTVYVKVADDCGLPWRELFLDLERTGYGKRRAVGYGAVDKVEIEAFEGLRGPDDADGFVALSAFIPARTDPTDGFWRAGVKYGKLGEERSTDGRPFKKPLVRILAGSVFRTPGALRPFYGRLIDGIAPGHEDVSQYAFAFAVPMKWRG